MSQKINPMKNRNIWIIVSVIVGVAIISNLFDRVTSSVSLTEIPYSEFISLSQANKVKEVVMRGDIISGKLSNGASFGTRIPYDFSLAEDLAKKGITVNADIKERSSPSLLDILISWFPMLLLIGVWIFIFRKMNAGGQSISFGKSKAKLMEEEKNKTTFADVAGVEEAKEEVREIVGFLKDPEKYRLLGGKIPKGVLLFGAPGTGKTLLARAIAGEAGVPFFSISGADFVEMFVGVGASRVRDMFEQAKKKAPCILFIDEIDAVGRHRGAGVGGGHDEREQTLNQILVEMDGFNQNEGVILIAATNRPDVLDSALLRPGRFDRHVIVPLPDIKGRTEILKVHMKKTPLADDVDPHILARGTPGLSGADLANLINEGALISARNGRRLVGMKELEEAKDKILMGAERKSSMPSTEENKNTAYHEAGHALVAYHLPVSDPIHKATIIPRGESLGMVIRLPEQDPFCLAKDKLQADIAIGMGGRVAEEIIFGRAKTTIGASEDLKKATRRARLMVTKWGMSDKLGPVSYDENEDEVFLGHYLSQRQNISKETALLIDQEVKRIVEEGYRTAQTIIKKHIKHLHLLAAALLEHETLSGKEITKLFEGGKLEKKIVIPVKRRRSSFIR